jgi:hypothetical protein
MDMKPTNAYKHLRVFYITNIVSLLRVHVSATLVAILRRCPTKDTYNNFKNQYTNAELFKTHIQM